MTKERPWKATRLEALTFIRKREIVPIHDLIDYYGYSYSGAKHRLLSLKEQGLIAALGVERGKYILTELGFDKLKYYGKL